MKRMDTKSNTNEICNAARLFQSGSWATGPSGGGGALEKVKDPNSMSPAPHHLCAAPHHTGTDTSGCHLPFP